MASPQPDIFFKMSKELWDAIIKFGIQKRPRQVFDAIISLTYGAFPPVKEAQISGNILMELTGQNKWQTSHALKQLVDMNLVAKNCNYRPASIGINKDYENWKELRKTATINKHKGLQAPPKKELRKTATKVAKNRNSNKTVPYTRTKRDRDKSESLYNFYKTEIDPARKSAVRAKKNISYYLKKHTEENLKKAIENYKSTLNGNDPTYRKDPANFFGRNEQYFLDFLPGTFEEQKKSDPNKWVFA